MVMVKIRDESATGEATGELTLDILRQLGP